MGCNLRPDAGPLPMPPSGSGRSPYLAWAVSRQARPKARRRSSPAPALDQYTEARGRHGLRDWPGQRQGLPPAGGGDAGRRSENELRPGRGRGHAHDEPRPGGADSPRLPDLLLDSRRIRRRPGRRRRSGAAWVVRGAAEERTAVNDPAARGRALADSGAPPAGARRIAAGGATELLGLAEC